MSRIRLTIELDPEKLEVLTDNLGSVKDNFERINDFHLNFGMVIDGKAIGNHMNEEHKIYRLLKLIDFTITKEDIE